MSISDERLAERIANVRKDAALYVEGSFSWNVKMEGLSLLLELQSRREQAAAALTSAEEEIAKLRSLVDFTIRWSWRDSIITDTERLSAIKYHPTMRDLAVKAGYASAALQASDPTNAV
jgi:hypothetical protein